MYQAALDPDQATKDGIQVPHAARLDVFFERYHWDYWTWGSQPHLLMEELERVILAKFAAQHERELQMRANMQTGAPATRTLPEYETTSDMLRDAADSGLPTPWLHGPGQGN